MRPRGEQAASSEMPRGDSSREQPRPAETPGGAEGSQRARDRWEHRPADPDTFLDDPEYLGVGDETWPEVRRTFREIVEGEYEEAAICWGIGSGKTYLASLLVSYLVHRALCREDPQRALGLAPGALISFMNMAPTGDQARRVVFGEIRERMASSPWFREHGGMKKATQRELRFAKNVAVLAGNSAETYPLGYNLLVAVMDEAGWLVRGEASGHDAAEEIYHALQRRVRSRFPHDGLVVMISSPRHEEDFLERKLREAEREQAIYASRKATWEVRPVEQFGEETFEFRGEQVPMQYRREFERDPERAWRDLGAKSTRTLTAFVPDLTALEACCDPGRTHPIDERGLLETAFRAQDSQPRFIHVDLGHTRDACGIAMAHLVKTDGEPLAVVDFVERIEPPPGGETEFRSVRERIYELRRRGFAIQQVSFDGWQSIDSRQTLRRKGFTVKEVSVDRTPGAYCTLRDIIMARRARWYRYEPLLAELRGLELVRGAKVDHRRGGSKDVADAVAGAVSEAVSATGGAELRARIA